MSTNLLTTQARGVYPIAVTPFSDDGAVDFTSLDRLTDHFISCGVSGVTYLGVLGEATKLSAQESMQILRRALGRIDGRAQVIVGASHVGFDNLREFVHEAMNTGASGIMLPPASGLKTDDQVANFFQGLIKSIGDDVPIVLQDYPQNSGVYLSAGLLDKLLKEHRSIKVVKHEEGSALSKISALRAQEAAGGRDRVSILVGNSGIHLPQELHRGVDGANTGVAFPEMLIEVCRRFFDGQSESAEDLYDLFLPLIRHEQQPGIGLAIRKEIFRRRGLIATARVRSPGPSLDANDHKELGQILARLQRKLASHGEDRLISAYQIAS
ncbi:4-hydroxy-tetrahydrodipicolinate synthase [Variovorax sp. YR634]|uniref:dihydrodipicolinate synthase family protein n=1 Tax=Variovorax sp. YR634 TaxID=1884385 RepID=UPI000897BB6F|nr:dihydrodipicolinate synthase family protein [Variovorax sp. YR634]SDZ44560.1 4-hydroxy-tetrahydrodipicolinate synthase [Variovorax sp. YR634]